MIDPVAIITAFTPDPTKWRRVGRGYVDWKFGQVAEYLGYQAAVDYVNTMRRWHDFEAKYQDCTLNTTYTAFCEAQKEITCQ